MLYLGRCDGDAPPICKPCISQCCAFYQTPGLSYVSDVFTQIVHEYIDTSAWRTGTTVVSHSDPESLIEISGIGYSVTLPESVSAVSLCGPVTERSFSGNPLSLAQDFSGLEVTLVGNTVSVSGVVIVQGWDVPFDGSAALLSAGMRIGVLCMAGDVRIVVEVLFQTNSYINPNYMELVVVTPYYCSAPCLDAASSYGFGYADGFACIDPSDPCAVNCADCSTAYLDGWTAGRAAAGGCTPCLEYTGGYDSGYSDGVACAEPADPCGEACPECASGYADGYADGWADGSCV